MSSRRLRPIIFTLFPKVSISPTCSTCSCWKNGKLKQERTGFCMNIWTRLTKWTLLPLAILLPLSAADKGITKQQADEILNELKQIRQLLEKQQATGAQPEQPTRAKVA